MPRRFQFSLGALFGLLTLAAVTVWAMTLFGVVHVVIALFLVSPAIAGVLVRKPLEGCLLTAFLFIVVAYGGFVAVGLLAG